MDEISIEIQLGNRKYSLRIKENESEVLQKASILVNKTLKDLEEKYQVKDKQDLFAMTALQLASDIFEKHESNRIENKKLFDNLTHIENSIDAMLEKI